MDERRFKKRTIFLIVYLVFAILPVYWMVNMSFKTNEEILSTFSLWPQHFTTDHYRTILLLCFILYNWMQRVGTADKEGGHG